MENQYAKKFRENIERLGGKVIGEYKGCDEGIKCLCKNGHVCHPNPSNIKQGKGMCKICSGKDSKTAGENFHKNIERLGGKVIGKYIEAFSRVECVCKNLHTCFPIPHGIQQGQGMCKICVGIDPKTASENFYKNIAKLEGKVIGKYTRAFLKVECVCKNLHTCFPIPHGIQQGEGMCPICNESKLERFFSEACKILNLTYISQYRNDDTKNTRHLKFDFHVMHNFQEIRVELQGYQHFLAPAYHHQKNAKKKDCTVLQSFIDRIATDNKKSFNTVKNNHSFLSISDLSTDPDEILAILQDYLSAISQAQSPLARYYITKELYIQYKDNKVSSPITFTDLQSDETLQRFQIYFMQAYSLLTDNLKKFKLYPCSFCGEYYTKLFLPLHYHTKEHKELLKESLGDDAEKLIGVTLDGNAIILS